MKKKKYNTLTDKFGEPISAYDLSKTIDVKVSKECQHDRHYSDIDGFAYCSKCGEYMQ